MKKLALFSGTVRVDDDDMVCLTDMWQIAKERAASGDSGFLAGRDIDNVRPVNFLRNPTTSLFLKELVKGEIISPLKTVKGKYGGTYAVRYLAYEYAGYIDPAFKVGVYTVLDKYFSGELISMASYIAEARMADHNFNVEAAVVSEGARVMNFWGLGGRKQYLHQKRQEAYAKLKVIIPDLPAPKKQKLPLIQHSISIPAVQAMDPEDLRLELILLNQRRHIRRSAVRH